MMFESSSKSRKSWNERKGRIPLLPTFSQVHHRVLSLALFSFYCTQALSVKSLRRLQFPIIYMLTTCKFTFHPISLMTFSPCSPPPLMKFIPGSLQIIFPSTHQGLKFLIIGNPQQQNKIQSSSIVFCGNKISPSASARNLGVTFDSSLSLTKHISSICKSAYCQIRQLRHSIIIGYFLCYNPCKFIGFIKT